MPKMPTIFTTVLLLLVSLSTLSSAYPLARLLDDWPTKQDNYPLDVPGAAPKVNTNEQSSPFRRVSADVISSDKELHDKCQSYTDENIKVPEHETNNVCRKFKQRIFDWCIESDGIGQLIYDTDSETPCIICDDTVSGGCPRVNNDFPLEHLTSSETPVTTP